MVYGQKFVMCVLVDGRPVRELSNGVVPVQYGQEYVLRFRNKNSRKAVVKFTIDGENVSGSGYVIDPHGTIDVRRHATRDTAFRFASPDSEAAVDAGKNGPNDRTYGIIAADFYLEKIPVYYQPYVKKSDPIPSPWPSPAPKPWKPWPGDHPNPYPYWWGVDPAYSEQSTTGQSSWQMKGSTSSHSMLGGSNVSHSCSTPRSSESFSFHSPAPVVKGFAPLPELQEGVTVEGSATGQRFVYEHVDTEDHVTTRLQICLRRIRTEQEVQVEGEKAYCTICGAKHRHQDRFCGSCGNKF